MHYIDREPAEAIEAWADLMAFIRITLSTFHFAPLGFCPPRQSSSPKVPVDRSFTYIPMGCIGIPLSCCSTTSSSTICGGHPFLTNVPQPKPVIRGYTENVTPVHLLGFFREAANGRSRKELGTDER